MRFRFGGSLAAFITGLFSVWIAVGSPLVAFDDDLLTIHMVQHVLLMLAAPPLILLGAPALPMLYGLPRRLVRGVVGPALRWPLVRAVGRTVTQGIYSRDGRYTFQSRSDRGSKSPPNITPL